MNLMGHYAAANHALIHKHIARVARRGSDSRPREPPQLRLERAPRRSTATEREVIVHRKGATPAGVGVLGVIPGLDGVAGFRRARERASGIARTARRTARAVS